MAGNCWLDLGGIKGSQRKRRVVGGKRRGIKQKIQKRKEKLN